MSGNREPERVETIIVGGGQAGLSVGYHLSRLGMPFLIVEANDRIGDSWRKRWDSLRLFTPAQFDGLDGMPFPAPAHAFPTKDEMADYLESYAAKFKLPVRTGVKVDRLSKRGDKFVISAGDHRFEANSVVVAMANFQSPRVPSFASGISPAIVQLHSSEYRNPSQLREGSVLVAGAGNSGAEIAIEVARSHRTWMSGRQTGQVPFRIDSLVARMILVPFLFRVVFHRHSHDQDSDGAQGASEGARGWCSTDSGERQRSDEGWDPARHASRWRAERTPGPRGRANGRCHQRHLVHRFSSRLFMDRSSDLCRVWRTRARRRRGYE